MVITVIQNIMWVDMIQKINRFPRFSNEEISVLHNEMKYTTKFSPINWGYSITTLKRKIKALP